MPVAGGSEFEIGGSAHKSCIYMWCMCMAYTCGTSIIYIYVIYIWFIYVTGEKFKQKWVIKGEGGGETNTEVIKQYLQAPAKT